MNLKICIISFIVYIIMNLIGNYIEKKNNELPDVLNSLPILYASMFYHLVNIGVGIIFIIYCIRLIFNF